MSTGLKSGGSATSSGSITWHILQSPSARLLGLLGCRQLPSRHLWLFPQCRAVHTLGMRLPIDVLFVDDAGCILACHPGLPPGRCCHHRGAWGVIEAAQGEWHRLAWQPGQTLAFRGRLLWH